MNKYQLLFRAIEILAQVSEFDIARRGGALPYKVGEALERYNKFATNQSVIESHHESVNDMARDFIRAVYYGAPKPRWMASLEATPEQPVPAE